MINALNLGDLAFADAGAKLADVVQILTDLRLEDWRFVPPDVASAVFPNLDGTLTTLTQMAELRSSQPDVQALHNQLDAQLQSYYAFSWIGFGLSALKPGLWTFSPSDATY